MGILYICGTPIGNLEDVSIRLLKTLRQVDLIACEDTRHTIKLLNHYKIKKPLISYHEHSHKNREDYLLQELEEGKNIALVSDAGMPVVSDPGAPLIRRAIEKGHTIDVIPGPTAFTAALVLSGLDSTGFIFMGFPPSGTKARKEFFQAFTDEYRTVIFYEAPHRLLATLADMEEVLGPKRALVLAREITKKHQEVTRGTIDTIIKHYEVNSPRGEICLVLGGQIQDRSSKSMEDILEEIDILLAQEDITKNEAFKIKARQYKISKSQIYKCFHKRMNGDK